jgi:hypothetical protein
MSGSADIVRQSHSGRSLALSQRDRTRGDLSRFRGYPLHLIPPRKLHAVNAARVRDSTGEQHGHDNPSYHHHRTTGSRWRRLLWSASLVLGYRPSQLRDSEHTRDVRVMELRRRHQPGSDASPVLRVMGAPLSIAWLACAWSWASNQSTSDLICFRTILGACSPSNCGLPMRWRGPKSPSTSRGSTGAIGRP